MRYIISLVLLASALLQSGGVPTIGSTGGSSIALPTSISNLAVWYSADCITLSGAVCSVPADGTTLTSATHAWADRSGNANDLKYVSGTCTFHTSQINSKPSVTFSTCNLNMTTGISEAAQARSAFVVLKNTSSAAVGAISSGTSSNSFSYLSCKGVPSPLKQQAAEQTAVTTIAAGTAACDTSWHQENVLSRNTAGGYSIAFRLDQATDTVTFNNGSSTASNPTEDMGYYQSTGNQPLAAQVAEFIYYQKLLNTTERNTVECYLFSRYALGTGTGC